MTGRPGENTAVAVATLQEWRKGVDEKLDALDNKIDRVLAQTTKTNGTVADIKAAELQRAAVRGFLIRVVKVAGTMVALGVSVYGVIHF